MAVEATMYVYKRPDGREMPRLKARVRCYGGGIPIDTLMLALLEGGFTMTELESALADARRELSERTLHRRSQ